MSKKIIVTGATGLIGRKVCASLIRRGDNVIVFSRSPSKSESLITDAAGYVEWDPENSADNSEWIEHLNHADAVIHLAGVKVIGRPWTEYYKQRIIDSRVATTQALVRAISLIKNKPRKFISASAVGYYDNSIDKEYDEYSQKGNDFLAYVTDRWEEGARSVTKYGLLEARIRMGIVLDKNEGALPKFLLPFKLFAGGPLAKGTQWFPWVHIDDAAALFIYAVDKPGVTGVLNASAPDFVSMNQFAKTLGKVLNRPSIFRVPGFILKLAFGEAADVLLKGSKIIPKRTLELGFKFRFGDLENALRDILIK